MKSKSDNTPTFTARQQGDLVAALAERFEQNVSRHPDVTWEQVRARLAAAPEKLRVLREMERTGGEPDVVDRDDASGAILFVDCSAETPKGRTSVCYDREGWESRKEHRPANTAMDMAAEIGVELLTEEQYQALQRVGAFDTKTSSWVRTPEAVRKRGGALYGERRYDRVFVGHNGAQSYYAVRGFRGFVWV
jgi:hypothetical protein